MNKTSTKKLTINELLDRWSWLTWQEGIEELLVTEHQNNGNIKSYIVSGLEMELEQDLAICSDYYDVLLVNNSKLVMFLQTDLKTITLSPYKDWYREKLVFNNHVIFIEKAS